MRSISHEMIHHAQNERGDFDNIGAVGEGYAQSDSHLRKMEKEAYLKGNMCFRDWEDGHKRNMMESIHRQFKLSRRNNTMKIHDWKNKELNRLLMEKFGFGQGQPSGDKWSDKKEVVAEDLYDGEEKISLPKISEPSMVDAEDALDIERLMRMDPREPDCNLLAAEKQKLQAIAAEEAGITEAEWDYLMTLDASGGYAQMAQGDLKTAVQNAIAAEQKCKALKVAQAQLEEGEYNRSEKKCDEETGENCPEEETLKMGNDPSGRGAEKGRAMAQDAGKKSNKANESFRQKVRNLLETAIGE